jgi:hypothetical protein
MVFQVFGVIIGFFWDMLNIKISFDNFSFTLWNVIVFVYALAYVCNWLLPIKDGDEQ